jgi:methyl-accepting chemotaxis protein
MRGTHEEWYNFAMQSDPLPSGPSVNRLVVPEDLQKQLHEANQRFSQARQNLEEGSRACDDEHTKHMKLLADELRRAEKELEQLNEKVQEILNRER